VTISEATYRLIEGYFICQALGTQTFRGVARPMPVYCVLRESGAQSRFDIVTTRGLTPLVGREPEVNFLIACWEQVQGGRGHVVLLGGEGGIGKSRLVRVLKDHVADTPHIRLECRSSPYYQNTALYPMIDLIERALQFQRDDTPEDKLEKLEHTLRQFCLVLEETVSLFARLLSLHIPETRYPPLELTPQRQRQKTLETILAIVLEQAARHPVLFILEDLHWTDPTTLAWLDLLIDQAPTAAILTLLTFRPTFQPTWRMHAAMTQVMLNRLSRQQAEQMVEQATGGKTFPQDIVRQIVDKTDGVPLFVEELTKMVVESGLAQETHEPDKLSGSLSALAIPSTLHDSLMARLDRLVDAKGIAQLGAVIGRQFSWELLHAVSRLDETTLQRELNRLVDAELLLHHRSSPPHDTYTFKHALIRDAAYESLLKSTRQQYHQQIAQILVERFPETAVIQPELLAHHYTAGGLAALAIPYWQRAGQRAIERSANEEAVGFLTTGLQLLKTLPDTPERSQHELHLQTTLGPALMATRGYAALEVEEAYARARELCQQEGDTAQILAVLQGLFSFYIVRGQIRTGCELGEQFLQLAQRQPDAGPLLMAHRSLGTALYQRGELHAAYAHCQQALALYKPRQHHTLAFRSGQDPGVACRSYAAWSLCLLGYLDQARERNADALALAREYTHAHTLVWSLGFAASFHQLCREGQAAQEHAEAAMVFASEHGFPIWTAWGTILRGWALAEQGQAEEGIRQMRQGMAAWQATGAGLWWPHFLAMLAEAYGKVGQVEAGLALLAEAIDVIHQTDERYYATEVYRLKGDLSLLQPGPNVLQAETCFHQALEVAWHQQAKLLELRTAVSLCRLWQQQGKRTEARMLLRDLYGWFTEGFDTVDLQRAKTLLEELG
jgi:predicted ATPase